MQPPAEVEPARISHGEQDLSSSAMLKMSAARAVSRELNDILRMASMIGRASNEAMSICSTTFCSSSALVLFGTGAFIASVSLTLDARRENKPFVRTERPTGAMRKAARARRLQRRARRAV